MAGGEFAFVVKVAHRAADPTPERVQDDDQQQNGDANGNPGPHGVDNPRFTGKKQNRADDRPDEKMFLVNEKLCIRARGHWIEEGRFPPRLETTMHAQRPRNLPGSHESPG
jgi:hypothetical protein